MDEKKDMNLASLDMLREIGTIGAGRAATALSELLHCKVKISLPQLQLVPLESLDRILGDPENIYFVVDIALEGQIKGRIFFLFPLDEARQLGGVLLGEDSATIDVENPLFRSSLEEVVNILSGSYFNALSQMTGLTVMYGAPSLALDMVAALLDYFFIQIAQHSEKAFFIKTQLTVRDVDFEGFILFFPDQESLTKMLSSLGAGENDAEEGGGVDK